MPIWQAILTLVLGGMLSGCGGALMFWAVFGDQITGKRRRRSCPRCHYDLPGATPPVTCPECGKRITRERQLHRSQRRPLMFGVGFVLAVAALIGAYLPYIKAYGYTRPLPYSLQLFMTWDGPDAALFDIGREYDRQGDLYGWQRTRLARLAREWIVDPSGSVGNETFAWALKYLSEGRDAAADKLMSGLTMKDLDSNPFLIERILQLSADRPKRIRELFRLLIDRSDSSYVQNLSELVNRIRRFNREASEIADNDAIFAALLDYPTAGEPDSIFLGHALRYSGLTLERGVDILSNVEEPIRLERGCRLLESILVWDTEPASISPVLVEKLMRIAERGDDSIAVAVGQLLCRKAQKTRADVLGGIKRVRDYVESGSLRQQIAGLMVIKTCVESERLPGFTDAALAVLRTSQSSEARDAALSILQRAPDAERPQVLSALREGPEAITIRLIDSVTYWSPDDPRATVAIRERLYDPNSSDAVKKAAFAALKRLNALGPSDSLPSGLWRSP